MPALPKTAVILVHGIGEQRPLDTLLGFVGDGKGERGILKGTEKSHWYINRDTISDKTYLRRVSVDLRDRTLPDDLVTKFNEQVAGEEELSDQEKTPPTQKSWARDVHFYEYYWAYRFRDTAWRHVGAWMKDLLGVKRAQVTSPALNGTAGDGLRKRLTGLAIVFWILMLATAVVARQSDHWAVNSILGISALLLLYAYLLAINPLGLIQIARFVLALIALVFLIAVALTVKVSEVAGAQWLMVIFGVALVALVVLVVRFRRLWVFMFVGVPGVVLIVMATWNAFAPSGKLLVAAAPVLTSVGVLLLSGAALGSVGDAASYLSNNPDNLAEREKIRRSLVKILRQLHTEIDDTNGRPAYDRIVLVGHSLGSVIAFDALEAYWAEASHKIRLPRPSASEKFVRRRSRQMVLERLEDCPTYDNRTAPLAEQANPSEQTNPAGDEEDEELDEEEEEEQEEEEDEEEADRNDDDLRRQLPDVPDSKRQVWRSLQRDLQDLLRNPQPGCQVPSDSGTTTQPDLSARWLVTDLITVGSPLAHAEILLAKGKDDLWNRKRRRLISANPPAEQVTNKRGTFRFLVVNRKPPEGSSTRLHHAAVFASTTWTNIYFRHDLVGGPLGKIFGNGVDDIELAQDAKSKPRPANFFRDYPHSSYWPAKKVQPDTAESVRRLRKLIFDVRPVLWVRGKQNAVKRLQVALAELWRANGWTNVSREDNGLSGEDSRIAFVELRVLRKAADSVEFSPDRWVWPGMPPWLTIDEAVKVIQLAKGLKLEVCLTDRRTGTEGRDQVGGEG